MENGSVNHTWFKQHGLMQSHGGQEIERPRLLLLRQIPDSINGFPLIAIIAPLCGPCVALLLWTSVRLRCRNV